MTQGLAKTRTRFSDSVANLILGHKTLDADLIEQIENQLITADVGVEATQQLIKTLTQKLARKELADTPAVLNSLQQEMKNILLPCQVALNIDNDKNPLSF